MTRYLIMPRRVRSAALMALVAALPLQACDTGILNVTDPDIILDADSPAGALALKNGVLLRLAQALNGVQGPDALFVYGGLITDEWRSGDTFVQRNNQDQRIWEPTNTFNADPYRRLNRVRVEGGTAIAALRQWTPPDSTYLVGRLFALIAYVEAVIGEHYCNGTPLSHVEGTTVVYGNPLTNDSLFGLAIASADSALLLVAPFVNRADSIIAQADSGLANPTPADTARWRQQRNDGVRRRNDAIRVRWLGAVVKGRALLDRGQFAAAAAAVPVTVVPDSFRYQITHSVNANTNQTFALNNSARRYTMVDREGTNGLDFISANDPRLPRATGTNPNTDLIFDSAYPLFTTRQGMWASTGTAGAVSIVTGVEARLIEAEAALQAGSGTWLTTVNRIRTTTSLYPPLNTGGSFARGPALGSLTDPGNQPAREDIMFRERAFWMFGTGHRLGDMRRLVRQYGRSPDSVYPIGAYFKGGNYGTALMMAVPFDEVNNPNFTQCMNQNP